MNCKPNDIAIVIKSLGGTNNGRIVTCKRFVGTMQNMIGNDLWLVDPPLFWVNQYLPYAPDSSLCPIRPGDLEEYDEEHKELTV